MKLKFSLAYKLVFSALIFLGILHRAGLFSAAHQLHTLYSFTTISNACVLCLTLFAACKHRFFMGNITARFARLTYFCLMMILITGIVYHFVLLPQKIAENPAYQVFTFGNIMAHYIAPIGMLVDWLLFGQKGQLSKKDPLLLACIPLLYFVIATLYGYFGSAIPGKKTSYVYFFMDIEQLGILGVAAWVAAILIFVLLLAYLVYAFDCILAHKQNSQTSY